MLKQSLSGRWNLSKTGDSETYPATVPGCVHTDLLAAEAIPDPFYRDQEKEQFWVGETDWSYTRTFEVSADLLAHEHVVLRCMGLDTITTLTLNGTELAQTENMFRTYLFDIKLHLQAGENTLQIDFAAPLTYAQRMDAEKGELAAWVHGMRTNSAAWIRKEPCNFGWDWGPMLTTSGIWREIEIIAWNTARIDDVFVRQSHAVDNVTLDMQITLSKAAAVTANVQVELDGKPVASAENVAFTDKSATATITIDDPQLWWVAGMGKQPLYDLTVTVQGDDAELDTHTQRIGLRTLELVREPDGWGESMTFHCNGVPFFAKGANWIPASPYPAATTAETYEKFLQATVDANMNMLRVWGGGIYEEDVFYDLCDEKGIAIWQDFMFACGTYPTTDADFVANVREEAIDNVTRLRNHACMALWCGNNEIEQGMPDPEWQASMSWEDYTSMFDDLLGGIVQELAPNASYWPGSPHSPCGDRNHWENQTCGDTHLWEVWHGWKPFEWYHARQDRFCSEFGFQSFPEPAVLKEFTLPEDHNLTSYIMEYRQRSKIGNTTIIHYMVDWFQLPSSFEDLVWLSQILQGLAMKFAVEHWRRNMPRTMGTLYWQLNDMWGAPSWASVDWKGNWKALHHMARHFYAPNLVSAVPDAENKKASIYATHDLTDAKEGIVSWALTTAAGNTIASDNVKFTPASNTSQEIAVLSLDEPFEKYSARDLLLWVSMRLDGELVSENMELFERPKHIPLQKPNIRVESSANGAGVYDVMLTTDVPALYTWLELPNASFSDNFFHLRPSVPKHVTIKTDDIAALVVHSLTDTY